MERVLACDVSAFLETEEQRYSSAAGEFVNKSAASAASLDYAKFQAVIKSAASAASLRGGRTSGQLDHDIFFALFGCASSQEVIKISDSV